MMRKLAVTVFALSLAALGCGSDSGTKTPDTGVTPDGGKTDTYVAPLDTGAADAPIGEVQSQPDTAKVDSTVGETQVAIDQAQGLDTAQVIDGAKGTEVQGEVQGIDGVKPVPDGGVDAPQSDAANAVDGGSVDAGTLG